MCNYTEIRIYNSAICSEPYRGILVEYVDIHKADKQVGFHGLKWATDIIFLLGSCQVNIGLSRKGRAKLKNFIQPLK